MGAKRDFVLCTLSDKATVMLIEMSTEFQGVAEAINHSGLVGRSKRNE